MRQLACLTVTLLLLLVPVGICSAETDVVTVTVDPIDTLTVPANVDMELNSAMAGTGTYAACTVVQTDGLDFSHNWAATKKITAGAIHRGSNGSNTMKLYLTLESGTQQTLVLSGTDQGTKDLRTGLGAGHYALDLTWKIYGVSLETTPAGTYVWDVTFTSSPG